MAAVLTVEKTIDIIERVCTSPEGRGTRDLARDLGMNVTTVHNIAKTLAARGYLRQEPTTKRFRPGVRLMMLGRHEDYLDQLTQLARPIVRRVAAKLNESVMLGTFDHGHVIKLDYVASSQALRVQEPDDLGPLAYCTAVGKVMLAAMTASALQAYLQQAPFKQFAPNTICTHEALLTELQRVRLQGFASTHDELCPGISAVAVRIRNRWGATVAALGASAPSIRMSKSAQRTQMIKSLRLAAQELADAWAGSLPRNNDGT